MCNLPPCDLNNFEMLPRADKIAAYSTFRVNEISTLLVYRNSHSVTLLIQVFGGKIGNSFLSVLILAALLLCN